MPLPNSRYRSPLRLCLVGIALLLTLAAAAPATAAGEPALSYFQGLVGAAWFDEDKLTVADPSLGDPNMVSSDDLSTLPCLGVAAQFALAPTPSHIGIDTSLLFGWHSDDTSIAARNGQARVEIDSDLWLLDVAIGLYAQTILGDRWRLYGAAGPMLLYGEYSGDTTEEDLTVTPTTKTEQSSDETAFGVGGYARLGLEYLVAPNAFVGVAVRGIATTLEFDDAVEDGGLTSIQGFVTFTRAY